MNKVYGTGHMSMVYLLKFLLLCCATLMFEKHSYGNFQLYWKKQAQLAT